MITDNLKLYQEREKRVNDAISLTKPDRVPVVTATEFFFTRSAGLTDAEAMYNYEKMAEGWKKSMLHYNWDMAPLQHAIRSGLVMEILGIKTFQWPGYNLPDNSYYQWVEKDYMMADEYDEFLRDPSDFTIRKLMPRMSGMLEPLADLPPITLMSTGYSIVSLLTSIAGRPEIVDLMEKLRQAGEEKVQGDSRGCNVLLGQRARIPFHIGNPGSGP